MEKLFNKINLSYSKQGISCLVIVDQINSLAKVLHNGK